MRFPLQVVKAVRAWPEHKPVFVRASATDHNNPDPVGHDPNG